MAERIKTKPVNKPAKPAQQVPVTMSDDAKALQALFEAMRTYGYDIPRGRQLSRRGLVEWFNEATKEKQVKQGGLTLANEKLAQIARSMVRGGQFEDPELAKLVSNFASNLEGAKPVAALLRKLKKAELYQTQGSEEPAIGTKPVETEGGRRYVPVTPKTRQQLEREISEPLRSLAGRQFVVVTPDGKQFPIALKADDLVDLRKRIVANPQTSGFFQSSKTRPSGELYDPVVKTEAFGRNMREAAIRQLLRRMRTSGQYPKGSKIMELDTNKMGNTVIERPLRRKGTGVVPGESGPASRQKIGSTLQETYEESMANRDEFGRIRQGRPTIGKTADLRTSQKPFSYDLPAEVDLVVEDGRMLFSYPGSNKPEPIAKVVAYYQKQAKKNPSDLQLVEDVLKVKEVESNIKFLKSDLTKTEQNKRPKGEYDYPTAQDVVIDRAGGRKPSAYERESEQDEQRAQDRRAFKASLQEEVAPKDRGSFARRQAAADAEITRAGAPGRGPKLATVPQMNKLSAVVTSYEKYMKSRGIPEKEIRAFLDSAVGGIESYKLAAESVPGEKGKFERYTRYVLPGLRGKGSKAIMASQSEAPLDVARRGASTRKDVSDAIRKIQNAEISARIDAGATKEQLIDMGFETSSYRGGKRPFNAPTTKSMIPGAFARKGSEQGIIAAAEKEMGTELRNKVEEDVKGLLQGKTQFRKSNAPLYNKLLALMYRYQKNGMSPSTFMRIAKTVDPRIDELVMGQARSAEAARVRGGKQEAETRVAMGDVPETRTRAMSPEAMEENQMLAGKSQRERKAIALAALAELIPQLEGQKPEGLGVEINVPPNLRGERSAEDVIAGAERRGRAATTREKQKETQALEGRVARALKELENLGSPTMRRASQERRRADTGRALLALLRKQAEEVGASSEFTPRTGRLDVDTSTRLPARAADDYGVVSEPRPYAKAALMERPTSLSPEEAKSLLALASRAGKRKGKQILRRYKLA